MIDKVPKLKVLLVGITSGFRSILYIAMLLGLCFYLYGCLGVILFHGADPTHFGSLGAAFITLFQLTTMESWGSIMFAIYYGCNRDATASGGKTSSSPADNSQLCDAGAADRASASRRSGLPGHSAYLLVSRRRISSSDATPEGSSGPL